MKFRVQITETLQKVVEVEAVDEDAAVDIVRGKYQQSEIVLMSEDFVEYDVEVTG